MPLERHRHVAFDRPPPPQALPVYYTLRAQLTRGEVSFSSSTLDFGPCYVTQQLVHHVTVKNEGALPQKFGFVNLRPEVDVQPNDGFGILLPFESKTVDVVFRPVSAVETDLMVAMRTTMNLSYQVAGRSRAAVFRARACLPVLFACLPAQNGC